MTLYNLVHVQSLSRYKISCIHRYKYVLFMFTLILSQSCAEGNNDNIIVDAGIPN